jgi:hypothetical protein
VAQSENRGKGNRAEAFVQEAGRKQRGLLGDYWSYLRRERKWWLTPVVFFLLVASAFIVLSGTGLAPFIYAIF